MSVSRIKGELGKNDIVVFVVPRGKYAGAVKDIVKAADKLCKKFCYVTLNKPSSTLVKDFKGVDLKKIVFIDGVTVGFEKVGGAKVVSVSSPKALTEINIAVNKVIGKEKVNGLVFDSLSTLLSLEQGSTVIKFSHSVISDLREKEVKGMFTVLKADAESELMKDLSMLVDKVVKL